MSPNVTSFLQPIDQGAIRCFQYCFCHFIVLQLINQRENLPENSINKSINILETIHLVNEAWKLVTPSTIQKSLNKSKLEASQPG